MKRAFVVSMGGYFVNVGFSMANAITYYGMQDIEFHIVCFENTLPVIKELRESGANIKAVTIEELTKKYHARYFNIPVYRKQKIVATTSYKYYRHIYIINELLDYDSVCLVDVDTLILHDLTMHFEEVEKTDKIVAVSWRDKWKDKDRNKYNNMDIVRVNQNAHLCTTPIWYKPERMAPVLNSLPEVMTEVFKKRNGNVGGDMPNVFRCYIRHKIFDNFSVYPSRLYNSIMETEHTPIRVEENGKRYLKYKETNEYIKVVHGKYWWNKKWNTLKDSNDMSKKAKKRQLSRLKLLYEEYNYQMYNMKKPLPERLRIKPSETITDWSME